MQKYKYSLTCETDDPSHPTVTKTVEAMSDDEAVKMLNADFESHMKDYHVKDVENMTPQQHDEYVRTHWTKTLVM